LFSSDWVNINTNKNLRYDKKKARNIFFLLKKVFFHKKIEEIVFWVFNIAQNRQKW